MLLRPCLSAKLLQVLGNVSGSGFCTDGSFHPSAPGASTYGPELLRWWASGNPPAFPGRASFWYIYGGPLNFGLRSFHAWSICWGCCSLGNAFLTNPWTILSRKSKGSEYPFCPRKRSQKLPPVAKVKSKGSYFFFFYSKLPRPSLDLSSTMSPGFPDATKSCGKPSST